MGCGEIAGLCSGCKHTGVFPALLFLLPGRLLPGLLICYRLERGFPRPASCPHLPFIMLVLVPRVAMPQPSTCSHTYCLLLPY